MKIRSITQFIPLSWPFDDGYIASAARLLTDARHRFADAGLEVQSICVATPPFLDVLGFPDADLILEFAHRLDNLAQKYHIDQISIGPVTATTPLALLLPIHSLPHIMAQTERIFSGVLFADAQSGVNLSAARALATVLLQIAHSTPGGSLRVAALANVPAHVPHLPVAYQQGSTGSFSIATEAADLTAEAANNANTLHSFQKHLADNVESNVAQMLKVVDAVVDDHQVQFKGIDFSLVPFPQQARSIGAAVEKLGIDAFGTHGTVFVISALARAVQAVNLPRVGFSGVMLPVLGDTVIAERNRQTNFTLNDLLLYSAVCGAGLDLVPIPGDTPADVIAAAYLDMAALSLTTGKPLSARLLPIPGAAPGDAVDLGRPELTGSSVIGLKNTGSSRLFERNSFLTTSRKRK